MGTRNWGRIAVSVDQASHQLLRTLRRRKELSRQGHANTAFQTTQQTYPTCTVETAKLAPRQNHELALVYEKEKQKGNANRATLAVARKMVAYLLAVDREERDFVPLEDHSSAVA
jgi:hypothetical protein